jgi:dienelactone hydrolase
MGGNFSYKILCDSNSPVDFGVACYPSRFDPELSKKLSFPMFVAFGEKDSMLPMEQVEMLRLNVKNSTFETKIEVYTGVGHAFAHNLPEDASNEQKEQQEIAFKDIANWYKKNFE